MAIGHAYATGIVTPTGMLAILAFGLLCYGYSKAERSTALHAVTTIATILFSLALMAHVIPGFSNLLIVRDAVVSTDAVPYTLYLNFDKAQIGLFLLAFGPPLLASQADWLTMLRAALPSVLVLIAIVMVAALWIGQVHLDLKWPEVFPIWAWSNLFFTCTAEETLFRGVIQRRLQGMGGIASVVVAGLAFGIAHFAGGVEAIVLATVAGVGYGWIFWHTNRIEASILAHFLVNTTHILCFTYPARV